MKPGGGEVFITRRMSFIAVLEKTEKPWLRSVFIGGWCKGRWVVPSDKLETKVDEHMRGS